MLSYKTRHNQDIFYVVTATIGDLNKTYDFLLNNPSVTLALVPTGIDVAYTKTPTVPPSVKSAKFSTPITSKTYTSRNGQSIFDVSLMTTTNYNNIYDIIIASGFKNINEKPKAGTHFVFNPQNITDNILAKYVTDNKIIFNTSERREDAITAYDKEFMDSLLFYFQDSQQYKFQ